MPFDYCCSEYEETLHLNVACDFAVVTGCPQEMSYQVPPPGSVQLIPTDKDIVFEQTTFPRGTNVDSAVAVENRTVYFKVLFHFCCDSYCHT